MFPLVVSARFEEALDELRRAQSDPIRCRCIISADIGGVLCMTRQYERAITQCTDSLRLDPHFARAHVYLGWARAALGRGDAAVIALETAARLDRSPWTRAWLGHAYGRAGRIAEARDVIRQVQELAGDSPGELPLRRRRVRGPRRGRRGRLVVRAGHRRSVVLGGQSRRSARTGRPARRPAVPRAARPDPRNRATLVDDEPAGLTPGSEHSISRVRQRRRRGLTRWRGIFDDIQRMVRHAVRALGRTPGATGTALATLALCLGVNLTIFAVVGTGRRCG